MNEDTLVGGRNFVVRVTRRGPRRGVQDEFELACRQVILPVLRVGEPEVPTLGRPPRPSVSTPGTAPGPTPGTSSADHPAPDELLVLRRGHTGATELSDWWSHERAALLRGSHDVDVTVLDDAGKPVTTWAFEGCHLVALRYSPLDAIDSDVLMETAEVSFDTVTVSTHRR